MIKKIFAVMLIVAFTVLTALADGAAVNEYGITEAGYSITKEGVFRASFDVIAEESAYALISAFDSDNRLVSAKIIPVTSGGYYADFESYDNIDYVKINLVDGLSGFSPLCPQTVIDNVTENGEVSIPMLPIFG